MPDAPRVMRESAVKATVTPMPGSRPPPAQQGAPIPEAKPAPLPKHNSWPREVWALIIFVLGVVVGLVSYDTALNRTADVTTKQVIAGQAIAEAKRNVDGLTVTPTGPRQR